MAGLDDLSLSLDGTRISVTVRRSPLAKTMTLRVDAVRGIVLVLPPRASLAKARAFLLAHQDWLAQRVTRLPAPLRLESGQTVPLRGHDHMIRHVPTARRGVWVEDGAIHVSGQAEHVARRVGDFLKAEAKRQLGASLQQFSERLERKPARITIKDTVSRWGSCSSQGHIALSWRLILAPAWVSDYVVGHEAAHLVEMNHSPAFWAIVASLGVDHHGARAWLKRHGSALHRYQLA